MKTEIKLCSVDPQALVVQIITNDLLELFMNDSLKYLV